MRGLAILAILLAVVSACSQEQAGNEAPQTPLVHFEVDEGPVENGKQLKLTYTEVARNGDVSKVAVKFTSGGSVSSSMFQVRGDCLVAQARGAKYFWNVGEDRTEGDVWLSEVQFSKSRGVHVSAFSIEDCKLLGFLK